MIEPLEKINTFIYRCDNHFLVTPLEDMLKEKVTYGLVVIGRKRATIGYIRGTQIQILKEFSSDVHSKQSAGGQSQKRFERLMQEGEKRFYRKVIKYINQEFLQIENLTGIFVGGAGNSKKKFIQDKYIDYRLKPLIQDTIDLPYDGGYEGIRELIKKSSNLMVGIRYNLEKKLVQKFLKELAKDSGLAIYGYKEVKKAVIHNKVKILILSEGVENSKYFISIANKNGIQVEIISKETEEGEMIYKSFGGIVALDRHNV